MPTQNEAAAGLRRGVRGALDNPPGPEVDPRAVRVSGWAFHAGAPLRQVVLTVDSQIVGTALCEVPRPDVVAAHGAAGAGPLTGWSTDVVLRTDKPVVTLVANAVLTAPAEGGRPARTILAPFAERRLTLVVGEDEVSAHPLSNGTEGSLDVPADPDNDPARFRVSGWALHRTGRVRLVVLTVDGEVVATAPCTVERPDVEAVHGSQLVSGWVADLSLPPDLDEVRLVAHALVEEGPEGGSSALVPFAEQVLVMREQSLAHGQLDPVAAATPGPLRVGGALADPDLVRAEVSVDDGATWQAARNSLPGHFGPRSSGEGALARFEAVVTVPDGATAMTLRARSVGPHGSSAEVPPISFDVEPRTPAAPLDAERAARLALRDAERAARLAAAADGPGRLLVAAHDLGLGGAQLYLDLLLAHLHRQGVAFCVVSHAPGALLERVEREYDAPVLLTGTVPRDAETLEYRVREIAAFATEHRAYGVLANTLVTFPAVLAAQRLGVPSAWVIHESFEVEEFWTHYLGETATGTVVDQATREALGVADQVAFVSEATRSMYDHLVDRGRSVVVRYGVPYPDPVTDERRRAVRAELGLSPRARTVACVGMMEARKAQAAIARAWSRLDPELRSGAQLCLVGADQRPYAGAVARFVEDTGLEEVHVVPVDADVMRWYAAADVLVSASDVESMPRTMLEAMGAGVPVAATRVFGVPELVREPESGWLCEPRDLGQLTAMLTEVLRASPEDVADRGRAAARFIRAHHDPQGYLAHFADLFAGWAAR